MEGFNKYISKFPLLPLGKNLDAITKLKVKALENHAPPTPSNKASLALKKGGQSTVSKKSEKAGSNSGPARKKSVKGKRRGASANRNQSAIVEI